MDRRTVVSLTVALIRVLSVAFLVSLFVLTRLVELNRWHRNLVLIVLSLSPGSSRGVGPVTVI